MMNTNTKRRFCLSVLVPFLSIFILGSNLFGQIDYNIWERNAITKDVISPPPTPSELAKYVEIPVSTYTGIPNISIPIYNIDVKGYSLPISLSYHASGIKVQQQASWVGLGWSLNAGGVITKVVRGIPDDQDSITSNIGKSGKLFSDHQFYTEEHGDNESDLYYFNFNGHSGKFYFDQENNAIYSGHEQPFKITYKTDSMEYFGVKEFTIVTDDGTKYIFADLEIITDIPTEPDNWDEPLYSSIFYTDSWYTTPQVPMNPLVEDGERRWFRNISSWYLSKIILPNSLEEITLDYEPCKYNYVEKTGELRKYGFAPFLECEVLIYNGESSNIFYTYKASLIDGVQLKKISWSSGFLSFLPSHADTVRQDIYNSALNEKMWFHHECDSYDDYEDYYGAEKYLDKIFLHDKSGDSIIEYDLDYGYFSSEGDSALTSNWKHLHNRLKLNGIQEKSVSGLSKPPYLFTYNTEVLPQRNDPQVDFWGYFNENGDTTLIPKIWAYQDIADSVESTVFQSLYCPIPMAGYGTADTIEGAIRTANPDVNQACMLKKITYPTGGYDEFTFETNQYMLGDSTYLGGGLRIKKIETKESTSGFVKTKEFSYLDESGNCTGRILGFPLFVSLNHYYDEEPDNYNDPFMYRHHSSSLCDLGSTKGSIVGYNSVTVEYENNGKEVFTYDIPGTLEDKFAYITPTSGDTIYQKQKKKIRWNYLNSTYTTNDYKDGYPYYPEPDFDWARGQLLKKEVYNEDGDILSEVENRYSIRYWSRSLMKWKGQKTYWSYNGDISSCNVTVPHWGNYNMLSGWKALEESNEYTYEPGKTKKVVGSTFYTYNDTLQLLKTRRVINSAGDTVKTIYSYSSDEIGEPYSSMVDVNMVNYLTKTEVYNESAFLQSNSTTYKEWDTDQFAPEYRKQKVGITEYTQVQFHDYNDKMNILSISKTNDIKQSFIWGYGQIYPIAVVQNAAENEIFHSSFEEEDGTASSSSKTGDYIHSLSGAYQIDKTLVAGSYQMTYFWRVNSSSAWELQQEPFTYTSGNITTTKTTGQIDELRVYPSDAMMTTYTYDPLVGLTSQTDQNNQGTYYEYDDLGRLKYIKDSNGNLLQQTVYHFATQ